MEKKGNRGKEEGEGDLQLVVQKKKKKKKP